MITNYTIEVHNIVANRWECFDTARTIDEAFEIAERAIGFDKNYADVAILDMYDCVVWDSNGFRQAEGLSYVAPEETRMKNVDLEAQQEAEYTAPDGS